MSAPWRRRLLRPLVGVVPSLFLEVALGSSAFGGQPQIGLTPALTYTRRLPLREARVTELFRALDVGALHRVPALWFDRSYDRRLPDLIFYFPGDTAPPAVQLIQEGATKQRLFGARHVWIVVFVARDTLQRVSDDALKGTPQSTRRRHGVAASVDTTFGLKAKAEAPRAKIRSEPIDYRLGLGDFTVVQGLAALVAKLPVPTPEGLKDDSAEVELETVGSAGRRNLFYGSYKIGLHENSVNRIRVALGDSVRTYTTFGNYSRSRTGLSFALVAGWPAQEGLEASQVDFQPYLPVHLFLVNRPERPRLPDQRHLRPRQRTVAHSLFIAPTVSDHPFSGFMAGYGANYWLGRVGVVIGPEFRKSEHGDGTTFWKTRWAVGVSVGL